jgi:hypothetical protein
MEEEVKMDFNMFVSGLLAEGLMALGVIKNPVTQETKKDLRHASHVIDALNMLQEKTKGNLTEDEGKGITEAIHHLRMLYVAESTGKTESPSEQEKEKKDQPEEKSEK